jgi:hypothetical protein
MYGLSIFIKISFLIQSLTFCSTRSPSIEANRVEQIRTELAFYGSIPSAIRWLSSMEDWKLDSMEYIEPVDSGFRALSSASISSMEARTTTSLNHRAKHDLV